jgi:RNA polymerase sigma factor (sigma-70 family)
MISLSKHRIVPGFNNREKEAIQWIYENYRVPVTVIIKRITGDNPDIEDLVSDTFLVLMEHKGSFESIYKIQSFLYKVATNKSLSYMLRRKTATEQEKGVAYYIKSREARAIQDAEASAAYHQLIHLAREKLPPRCKQVFMLCYIEQLSTREIAKRLDISEKTVANLKLHSYKLLKKEIDPSSGSPLLPVLLLILLSLK